LIYLTRALEANRQFYTPKTSGESSLVFSAISYMNFYLSAGGKPWMLFDQYKNYERISRQKIGRQGIALPIMEYLLCLDTGFAGTELSEEGLKIAPILPEG